MCLLGYSKEDDGEESDDKQSNSLFDEAIAMQLEAKAHLYDSYS